MLKTLRMREFNNHLEEGIAHLKAFPGSKSQQLNHHSIPILREHEYDGAIIHVGINNLIKNPNENKARDSEGCNRYCTAMPKT